MRSAASGRIAAAAAGAEDYDEIWLHALDSERVVTLRRYELVGVLAHPRCADGDRELNDGWYS